MDKIQEAFKEFIGDFDDTLEPEKLQDLALIYKAGYKAAEEALKCCGNCRYGYAGQLCKYNNLNMGTTGDSVCEEWE